VITEQLARQHAERLQESTLFKGVSIEDRVALIQMMRHEQHEDRVVLFRKDDPGDTMYIILSGRIRIFMQGSDKEHTLTLRFYDAPQIFGEFAPLDEKPRSASAATVGTTELLVLSRDDLLTFVKSRPLVGLAMMRNLVERLRYTTDYLRLVTESIQKLSQGDYEQLAAQLQSTSSTDAEIQKMISAFIIMVQSVQERERALRHET
jgi:CRP-like cAMP-binding protein